MSSAAGADSWFDIFAYVLVALPGVVASIVAWRIKVQTAAVEDQVSNDHATNLRDDIDGIRDSQDSIKVKLGEMDRTLHRIENEQRADQSTISDLTRDLYASISRQERIVSKYHPDDARDSLVRRWFLW